MMGTESQSAAAGLTAHWLADLDSYQVEFLILDAKRDRTLLNATRTHPSWTIDYDDGDAIVLTRAHTQAGVPAAARVHTE